MEDTALAALAALQLHLKRMHADSELATRAQKVGRAVRGGPLLLVCRQAVLSAGCLPRAAAQYKHQRRLSATTCTLAPCGWTAPRWGTWRS